MECTERRATNENPHRTCFRMRPNMRGWGIGVRRVVVVVVIFHLPYQKPADGAYESYESSTGVTGSYGS